MLRARVFFDTPARGISRRRLENFLRRAARAKGLAGKVNVIITDVGKIRLLNRRFFGRSSATDVIAFGVDEPVPGEAGGLSEIYVCLDEARRQGRRLGHGVVREIKLLIAHGILHLSGLDDDSAASRAEMLEAGEELADRFGK